MKFCIKKLSLLIIFSGVFIFCPLVGRAIMIQVTVNIESVLIPERAAMILRPLETEFMIRSDTKLVITDKNGVISAASEVFSWDLSKGATYTYIDDIYYNENDAPYKIYLYLKVRPQEEFGDICMADCTNILEGSGWYYIENVYYDGGGLVGCCPHPPCNSACSTLNEWVEPIAIDPEHVVHENNNYWWPLEVGELKIE